MFFVKQRMGGFVRQNKQLLSNKFEHRSIYSQPFHFEEYFHHQEKRFLICKINMPWCSSADIFGWNRKSPYEIKYVPSKDLQERKLKWYNSIPKNKQSRSTQLPKNLKVVLESSWNTSITVYKCRISNSKHYGLNMKCKLFLLAFRR